MPPDAAIRFVDWEGRPAVIASPGVAFAVLAPGTAWQPVIWAEVLDSGRPVSEALFRRLFGPLPPLPVPDPAA